MDSEGAMANPHLNPLYTRENALQAINAIAARTERDTGIAVIRCHLGNPLGPQWEKSDQVVADYYRSRSCASTSRGYADVIGPPGVRQVIANALTSINRLPPGLIDKDSIRGVTGGTGGLNVAISIFKNPTVLIADPFYPSWVDIAHHLRCKINTFALRQEDDYLVNFTILSSQLDRSVRRWPSKPIVLIYHYPNNPTGKTLSENEARDIAESLNRLCAEYPTLYLIQEDLYLATIASDMGIYTPLAYLNDEARQRTICLMSPSKMGHAQDRGAVISAFNSELLRHLRGAVSFNTLGPTHPSLLITASTPCEVADGGCDPIHAPGSRADDFRFRLAAFYQERVTIIASGIRDIEKKLGVQMLAGDNPKGAYYLFPSLECLRGEKIPRELLSVYEGATRLRNSTDVARALQFGHLIGLQPLTIASDTLFTKNLGTMRLRIAAVEPEIMQIARRSQQYSWTGSKGSRNQPRRGLPFRPMFKVTASRLSRYSERSFGLARH